MNIDYSSWVSSFKKSLFETNPNNFEVKSINLFRFQLKHNEVYQKYCQLIGLKEEKVKNIEAIPFLPISTFKTHKVVSSSFKEERIFTSSGTTANTRSQHFVKDTELYQKSFTKGFELFYGSIKDYCVLALLPSYLERQGSSLIYMTNDFIEKSQHKKSGFFLHNTDQLFEILQQLNSTGSKVLLLGVSFALLDFVEQYDLAQNNNLVIMETGGMKGRRKEIIREELHSILEKGFKTKKIHSEYGMTELLSQAYSKGEGKFKTPPWMKVLVRKQDDPFSYTGIGEAGAINVIDFANIDSCPFIQTDDLGKLNADGTFNVLGRFDASEVRGCNLMVH